MAQQQKTTPDLLLQRDQEIFKQTRFPIVTLSASFRDILEMQHQLSDQINHPDIVLSRAHYSMAQAAVISAWGGSEAKPEKAWLADPTNYVNNKNWRDLAFTQFVGRTLARHPLLTWIKKTVLDRSARSKLPIADEITPPLLKLMKDVRQPIISFHIEIGNILAKHTKLPIVQAVTDPHVREQYTDYADRPNTYFAVFDQPTKESFLEIAGLRGKKVDPSKIVVTGPFIDPRVKACRTPKSSVAWKKRPLRIMLTTGGLGTNKAELEEALRQLLPLTRRRSKPPVQIMYYAGTNRDHGKLVQRLAKALRVPLEPNYQEDAKLRLIYADDLVEANEQLIRYGFPWADIVVGKPSGDMAYDAVAAGCSLLLLHPWGEWEEAIANIFLQAGLAKWAQLDELAQQIDFIQEKSSSTNKPWLEESLLRVQKLDPEKWLNGAENILKIAKK